MGRPPPKHSAEFKQWAVELYKEKSGNVPMDEARSSGRLGQPRLLRFRLLCLTACLAALSVMFRVRQDMHR